MRIVKNHDERRNEILDAAERLFHQKGFEKCTVQDILQEVGIAKGTFYYYFKSKEEVLDAIVLRYTELLIKRVEEVIKRDLPAVEKLALAFLAMRMKPEISDEIYDQMHKSENALLHQKSLQNIVSAMAPLLAQVVEEGEAEGVWSCKYPLEYMQIFLAATLTLTDEGIFQLDETAQMNVLGALISLLENMLQVPEGLLMQQYAQHWS